MKKDNYIVSPFGSPDGANSELIDIMNDFIEFNPETNHSGIATAINPRTRIIVGSKGSGKTIYLRRLREFLKKEPSIYLDEDDEKFKAVIIKIEGYLRITEKVIWYTNHCDATIATVCWQRIWNASIILAITDTLLDYCLQEKIESEEIRSIKRDYEFLTKQLYSITPKFIDDFDFGMNIFDYLEAILEITSIAKIENYLKDLKWKKIKKKLKIALKKIPPIWFFIDCVDEEYRSAPLPWMCCQQGLFYTVSEYLHDENFTNRVHIVISIRDQVMYKVKTSEHAQRYRDDLHIKILSWNYNSIRKFFERKIERIDSSCLIDKDGEKNIKNWLGTSTIINITRHEEEDLIDYIIRHTTMIPRDIVIMGNELNKITKSIRIDSDKTKLYEKIREVVHKASQNSGEEMLKFSLNHIRTNCETSPIISKNYNNNPKYWMSANQDEYNKLLDIIRSIKSDRFSYESLQKAMKYADDTFGKDSYVFDILWINGAIGYTENNIFNDSQKEVWASIDNSSMTTIPLKKQEYLIRSCVVDAVGQEYIEMSKKPIIGSEK